MPQKTQGEQPQAVFDPNKEIVYLHLLRGELAKAQQQAEVVTKTFQEANAALFTSIGDLISAVKSQETKIRSAALSRYDADQTDKEPFAGVAIRVGKKFEFDPAEALTWAQECNRSCITPESLNAKAFDAVCKSDELRPDLVIVKPVPSATIATDLSKVLGLPAADGVAAEHANDAAASTEMF